MGVTDEGRGAGVATQAVPLDLLRGAASEKPVAAPRGALERIVVRESRTRMALVLADVLAVAAALWVAIDLLGPDRPRTQALLALPLAALVSKASGMYDRDELVLHRSTLDELPRLFSLVTLGTLLVWLGDSQVATGPFAKIQVVGFFLTLLASAAVARWLARASAVRLSPPERALVLADASSYERVRVALGGTPGVELAGAAPLDDVLCDLDALRRRAEEVGAERLVIAPPTVGQHEDVLNLIRGAKATGLRVSLVPSLLEVVGSAVEFDELGGLTILGLKRFGLTRSSRRLKRGLDLAGAAAGLFALGPTMLVIALLVRRDSPGGALYRQTRVGRDGRPFEILKFRTMVDGAHAMRAELAERNEAVGLFKIADDPRVTRVGRLLRATSLDELPQLINVLRGEMSLVGPRPLVVDEDDRVTGLDRRRLVLTPGMTGPWQIAGSARVPLHEMVKMDYLYAAGWSLWRDVKILLRTVTYMLARRGQ